MLSKWRARNLPIRVYVSDSFSDLREMWPEGPALLVSGVCVGPRGGVDLPRWKDQFAACCRLRPGQHRVRLCRGASGWYLKVTLCGEWPFALLQLGAGQWRSSFRLVRFRDVQGNVVLLPVADGADEIPNCCTENYDFGLLFAQLRERLLAVDGTVTPGKNDRITRRNYFLFRQCSIAPPAFADLVKSMRLTERLVTRYYHEGVAIVNAWIEVFAAEIAQRGLSQYLSCGESRRWVLKIASECYSNDFPWNVLSLS